MTRPTTKRLSFGAVFLLAVSLGHAQTLVIPQIADGGGWQTTLVLTNTNTLATTASLSFFRESGGVSTQSWDLTFLEVSSTQNLPLPSGGTLFLHTPGAASATTAGWAGVCNIRVNSPGSFIDDAAADGASAGRGGAGDCAGTCSIRVNSPG